MTSGVSIAARMSGRVSAYKEQQIIKDICDQFDVVSVVKDFNISSVRKTELFLLGATFSTCVIRGLECDIMIMNKVLYILDITRDEYGKFD